MLITKRTMTEAELDIFLKLRETDNVKAAAYMKSLESELFETYGREREGSVETSKDRLPSESFRHDGYDSQL